MPKPKVARERIDTDQIAASLKRERPDLDPADYMYLLASSRLGRLLVNFDDRHCRRDFNISGSDMRILFALRRTGPPYALRPTQLFHSLLITSGAVTKHVDRLQALGLVERRDGPLNSGGFLIALTETGMELTDRGLELLTHWSQKLLTSLTRDERNTLSELTSRLIRDLERQIDQNDSIDEEDSGRDSE